MIIISAHTEEEEQEIAALLEQTLKDRDVQLLQNDGQELNIEATAQSIAYNAKQLRIYTGRLERNTRNIEQTFRKLEAHLGVIASYVLTLIIEQGDDPETLKRLLSQREWRIQQDAMTNPPVIGGGRITHGRTDQ